MHFKTEKHYLRSSQCRGIILIQGNVCAWLDGQSRKKGGAMK